MGIRGQELIVPGLISFIAVSFWLSVRGQAQSVVLVPYALLVVLSGLTGVVICREVIIRGQVQDGLAGDDRKEHKVFGVKKKLAHWLLGNKREFGFLLLSFGYYIGFEKIGFNLANILFLMLAFPVSGVDWKRSVIYTFVLVLVVYATAELMQMDAPKAPWFR